MTTTVLAYLPSPSQGIWHLGPVPIRAYALCIIIGIVAALIIGDRRWEARGGERGVIYDIALWAVPFGLVGGRLYHVMTDWRTYFGAEGKGLGAAFQIWEGGLGIWGAVALGGLGAWIGCRQRGIPLPAFGDAIAPGIILAQAIGRLGNYFNQELYGRATTLPWGLEIYDRRNAVGARDDLNGVSNGDVLAVVHPTFLYELLWNLLIFVVLLWADRRFKLGHGRLFALYVAGYCVGRFWVELMRSDLATHVAGFRINTLTSTFVFIGAVVYIMLAPKGREEPASLAGDRADGEDTEDTPGDNLGKELVTVAATSGVVAAATAAGRDEAEDDADHMHVDEVTTSEGAEAAAAVELKAIVPQASDADSVDDVAESGDESEAAAADAETELADADVDPEQEVESESAGEEQGADAEVTEAPEVGTEVASEDQAETAEADEVEADTAVEDQDADADGTEAAETAVGTGEAEADEVEVDSAGEEQTAVGDAEADEVEAESESAVEDQDADAEVTEAAEGDAEVASEDQAETAETAETAEADEVEADTAVEDQDADADGTETAETAVGTAEAEADEPVVVDAGQVDGADSAGEEQTAQGDAEADEVEAESESAVEDQDADAEVTEAAEDDTEVASEDQAETAEVDELEADTAVGEEGADAEVTEAAEVGTEVASEDQAETAEADAAEVEADAAAEDLDADTDGTEADDVTDGSAEDLDSTEVQANKVEDADEDQVEAESEATDGDVEEETEGEHSEPEEDIDADSVVDDTDGVDAPDAVPTQPVVEPSRPAQQQTGRLRRWLRRNR